MLVLLLCLIGSGVVCCVLLYGLSKLGELSILLKGLGEGGVSIEEIVSKRILSLKYCRELLFNRLGVIGQVV